MPRIVPDSRALLLNYSKGGRRSRAVVIADLHLGLEEELEVKGLFVPDQAPVLAKEAIRICRENRAKRLVVLGDIKNSISVPTAFELDSFEEFLRIVTRAGISVDIVPGNHDGALKLPMKIRGVRLHGASGFSLGDCALFHGHANPERRLLSSKRVFVLSHIHPKVRISDTLGKSAFEPCFFLSSLAESEGFRKGAFAIVLPAFNRLVGGADISNLGKARGFPRFLSSGKSRAVLLDGTILGEMP